jgi:pantoate--beta-alanine ligase
MVKDTLLSHPTPDSLHILPISRAEDNLALSSRNVYLSSQERKHAPCLYAALLKGRQLWESGAHPKEVVKGVKLAVEKARNTASLDNVNIELDYIALVDAETFEMPEKGEERRAYLLCGAIKVGSTRLLDNIVLGDTQSILY